MTADGVRGPANRGDGSAGSGFPANRGDDSGGSGAPVRAVTIETPQGPSRVTVPGRGEPVAVLMLGHGAGGGINAFDLVTLAAALPALGVVVVLHEQPWRGAGKRIASRPPTLDEGWRPALDWAAGEYPGLPLWTGGRSAGARVACRCYDDRQAGVVCLAFPLHPPGRPEASRVAELAGVTGPVLVVQGERDPFGTPGDVRTAVAGFRSRSSVEDVGSTGVSTSSTNDSPGRMQVVAVPGTHSFNRRAEVRDRIVGAVRSFIYQPAP